MLILVKGAGDLATGTAVRLVRSGFQVVMAEVAQPTAVRRTVAFSQCMYDGTAVVEGITARRTAGRDQARAALAGEPIPPLPPLAQRCDTAVRQFELSASHKGEHIACLEARKHYTWYLKGIPYAGYYKQQISRISTLEDIYQITAGIKRDLTDAV